MMLEEVHSDAKDIAPKSRKLYICISVLYGLLAIGAIWGLSADSYPYHPIWLWTDWLDIAVDAWCVYFFFEIFSAVSNRIEKPVCFLSMICFALGIAESLHTLGYGWAQIPAGNWINAVLITIAALLMFLRTFQVFRGAH